MNEVQSKSITETSAALREAYEVFRNNKPLAVGIKVELEGCSPAAIQHAVSRFVATSTYLRNVKYGTHRFNLDGTQAEEIKPEHKEMARLKLNVRAINRTWHQKDMTGLSKKSIVKKQARYEKRLEKATIKIKTAVAAFKSKV